MKVTWYEARIAELEDALRNLLFSAEHLCRADDYYKEPYSLSVAREVLSRAANSHTIPVSQDRGD